MKLKTKWAAATVELVLILASTVILDCKSQGLEYKTLLPRAPLRLCVY
jgi:hypothetical protein